MKPVLQQPTYADAAQVESCFASLQQKPPLVAAGEIERLRIELAEAAEGRRFILHGGDCAELFSDCTAAVLKRKLQVLLQMSMVLTYATRKPVTRIGRMAGQYAKPRSNETEKVGDISIPVYRGDLINHREPTERARRPNPERMLNGYYHAAASLNFIRALIEGGFADLHHPEWWDLGFIEQRHDNNDYRKVVDAITDVVQFMDTIGAGDAGEQLRRIAFYTSHEALLLPYEEALTCEEEPEAYYNMSAHFLWLGYRTSNAGGAHVEYLRGIRNPIGIKVGPSMNQERLLPLLDLLNPKHIPGRITLITRFGVEKTPALLPPLIRAVQSSGHPLLWCCDPMHGNTESLPDGRKTRRLTSIFSEIERTFAIHGECNSFLGGIHFELTGERVTECMGGSGGLEPDQSCEHYITACDPRLNGGQSLEMAFLIARLLR